MDKHCTVPFVCLRGPAKSLLAAEHFRRLGAALDEIARARHVTEGATSAPAKEIAMKWVTRKKARVDRIACPWLIQRFVDPAAEFLFVPDDLVTETARREGAIPFDVPDVELGHHGDRCSFDAFLEKYRLTEPALQTLARIVRGADTDAR